MRIAIWHNLPSGGGKRALYDQVKGLVDRGHYVESWCPQTADQSYLPLSNLIKENVVGLRRPKSLAEKMFINFFIEKMDEHCLKCVADMHGKDFDVILVHPCMFFRVTSISRASQLPTVLYLQEPYRWLYEAMPRLIWLPIVADDKPGSMSLIKRLKNYRNLINARFQANAEISNASRYKKILVNSYFSRESVLRAYALDSEVCYLGTDTNHFSDLNLPRERFFVGLGAFTPEKNVRLVLEALSLLPDPKPSLVWIGNIAYAGYLEEMQVLADNLQVHFVPHLRLSDKEVVDILNRATAMIYTPRLEPFGYAPIEAAACALPVIAVAEGGVRETVIHKKTGLLVSNSPRAIADAALMLLRDTTAARTFGRMGRENAEQQWSISSAIDRIENSLQSALN